MRALPQPTLSPFVRLAFALSAIAVIVAAIAWPSSAGGSVPPRVRAVAAAVDADASRVALASVKPTGRELRQRNRSRRVGSISRVGGDDLEDAVPPALRHCQSSRRLWRQWERLRRLGSFTRWNSQGDTATGEHAADRPACP